MHRECAVNRTPSYLIRLFRPAKHFGAACSKNRVHCNSTYVILHLQGMQQHSKALTAYQKALELDPSNAEALEGYRACSTQLNSNPEEVCSVSYHILLFIIRL